MAKYMFLYKGPATDMSQFSEEESNSIMADWQKWMESLGDAMVEMGNPFGESASVVDDGSAGEAAQMTGYSIVEASSMDEARSFTDKHPFLSETTGDFSVDIFELVPM